MRSVLEGDLQMGYVPSTIISSHLSVPVTKLNWYVGLTQKGPLAVLHTGGAEMRILRHLLRWFAMGSLPE